MGRSNHSRRGVVGSWPAGRINNLRLAEGQGFFPARVPKRWIKFIVGIFLLVPCWVLTQTFFTVFTRAAVGENFWRTEEFYFFVLGAILWLVAFFSLPRPFRLYVVGHELTHALWVLAMGGRVHRIFIGERGGHVLADRTNTWIALAPYFFPFYSLLVIGLYGLFGIFWDLTGWPWRPLFYALVGLTWAFHLSFTCWLVPQGQPDLRYGGTFFSLTVIYFLNLVCLSVMLILATRKISFASFLAELFNQSMDFTVGLTFLINEWIR